MHFLYTIEHKWLEHLWDHGLSDNSKNISEDAQEMSHADAIEKSTHNIHIHDKI